MHVVAVAIRGTAASLPGCAAAATVAASLLIQRANFLMT